VCVTYGLGLMSVGFTVGKKVTILKHCVECVCTLQRWIYIYTAATGGRLLPAAKQPHPDGFRVTQIEALAPRSGQAIRGPDGLYKSKIHSK